MTLGYFTSQIHVSDQHAVATGWHLATQNCQGFLPLNHWRQWYLVITSALLEEALENLQSTFTPPCNIDVSQHAQCGYRED